MTTTGIIKKYLERELISVAKLADRLGDSRQNLSRKLRGNDIDTGLMMDIAVELENDFFTELSHQFRLELAKKRGGTAAKKQEDPALEFNQDLNYYSLLEENVKLHRELRATYHRLEQCLQTRETKTENAPKTAPIRQPRRSK